MKKLVCMILAFVLGIAAAALAEQPETGPDEDNTIMERALEFFSFWRQEDYDGMLELCSPAWKSGKYNVRKELFYDLGIKTPMKYYPVSVTGLPDDDFRSVVIDATMEAHNSRQPSDYRLVVSMSREDGQWYVDPESLRGHEGDAMYAVPGLVEDQEEVIDLALKYCSLWQQKDYDGMKELCAPYWQKEWETTRNLLDFYMPGIPVAYEFAQLEESGENVCSVKLKVTMEFLHNGTDPYRFNYIMPFDMSRENGVWYVDPVSIQRVEAFEEQRDILNPHSTLMMAEDVLEFFSSWSWRDYDAMIGQCSPVWQETQQDVIMGLLSRLGTAVPTDFRSMSVGEITEVATCYVNLDVMMDPCNGKDPELRHYVVLMVWENGMWYVDPDNIRCTETVVTEQVTESPETAEDANG